MKRFKILKTNLNNVNSTHFECTTSIGSESYILNETDPFRCFMFDGIRVKLVKDNKYILGEIHG